MRWPTAVSRIRSLTLRPPPGSDPSYNNARNPADVSVTNTDNDIAGIAVTHQLPA